MFGRRLDNKVQVPLPKVVLLRHERRFSVAQLLAFVLVFAGIGAYIIIHSFAASVSCTTTISPGADISASFNSLGSGQTLCLNSGTYNASAPPEYGFSNSRGVTLAATPGATPIVHGWPYVTGTNSTFTGITWILDGGTGSVTNHCGPNGYPNPGFPAYTNGTFQIQASGVTLSHNDISEKGLSQSYRGVGVSVGFSGNVNNVKIFNNRIHDIGDCGEEDHAVYLAYATNPQVYGNWIYNIPAGTAVETEYTVSGGRIYSNVIDHVSAGFTLSNNTNGVTYDHNVITNVGGNHGLPSSSQGTGCASGCGVWTYGISGSNTWSMNDYYPNLGSGIISGGSQAGISNQGGNLSCDPGFRIPASGNPPQTGQDSGNTPDYRVSTSSCVASWGLWDGDLSGTTSTPTPPPTPTPNPSPSPSAKVPSTPAGLKATAGNAQVVLNWTANVSTDSITHYNVYRSDQAFTTPWASPATTTFTNASSTVNGTQYCFQVSATNSGGESVKSSAVCATPRAATKNAPAAPSGLTATAVASGEGVTIAWKANAATDSVAHYNIYRSDQTFSGPWAHTATTSFTNNDQVVSGKQYCFQVSASNSVGESARTAAVCAIDGAHVPSVPTGLKVVPVGLSAVLNWAVNPSADSVTHYNVYRTDQTFTGAWSSPTAITFTNADQITKGKQYCYQVSATNAKGEGRRTTVACVKF